MSRGPVRTQAFCDADISSSSPVVGDFPAGKRSVVEYVAVTTQDTTGEHQAQLFWSGSDKPVLILVLGEHQVGLNATTGEVIDVTQEFAFTSMVTLYTRLVVPVDGGSFIWEADVPAWEGHVHMSGYTLDLP